MIGRSLLIYVTFSLCVTILFSTENQKRIQNSLLGNEIIPIISQTHPSFKLYDFLIYPSNDGFKYNILPFLSSSEDLLKIIFHFQKLNPNVNLRKFLPNSNALQDSLFPYIFQDEGKFFNPILCSEKNYEICTLNDKNIEKDSVCTLFPSNKIFLLKTYFLPNTQKVYTYHNDLKTYVLQDKQKVYAYHNEENGMFLVAIKTNQETLVTISRGNIKLNTIKFPNFLTNILEAHNLPLTCFSKLYYKVFDFYQKYHHFVEKTRTMLGTVILPRGLAKINNYINRSRSCVHRHLGIDWYVLLQFFYFWVGLMVKFFYFWVGLMVKYHTYIFPFHIVSIPFEIFFKNHFSIFGDPNFAPNFFNFWIFPCVFYSIFDLFYGKIQLIHNALHVFVVPQLIQIKPLETMWVVPYLPVMQEKRSLCESLCDSLTWSIFYFFWGLYSSFLFLPFFMIHGEYQDE
jgi:hypothetical protein